MAVLFAAIRLNF